MSWAVIISVITSHVFIFTTRHSLITTIMTVCMTITDKGQRYAKAIIASKLSV